MKLIGVDVGGTKITAALIDDGQIRNQYTVFTPSDKEMMVVVKAVVDAISEVFVSEVAGIGLGIPGLVDLNANLVIDVANIPSWKEVPLKHLIEERFHRPVVVNNDANCFVLGERVYGKGRDFTNFVGLTLGTGLGTGIVAGGKLYSGAFCGAGEFGSMPFRNKTIEAYASGQFFKDRGLNGSLAFVRAMEGKPEALLLFREFGNYVGYAVAQILLALAPEAILIGGSVSQSFHVFADSMYAYLEAEFPYQRLLKNCRIELSELKNSALLGAAALIMDALESVPVAKASKTVSP